MPVFSLKEAKELQVKNVSEGNFKYWSESATYGYFGGGANSPFPTRTNILSRLDFSNETLSNPGKNLPSAIDNNAAVTSSSYGYYGGGLTAPTTFINTVSRLDFSNETISLPGKNLPVATSDMGGVSGSSYGYFGGGSTPTIANTVSRLDFSSETLSLPGKNLPVATTLLTATSSTSYGYFGAGFPPYGCTISRLDFSTENVSLPGKDLPYGRYTLAATSSNYYGYFGGGQITTTTYSSVISRLDFSTEGTSSFPTQGALQDAAVGNSSYGYFGGGEVNTIRRFDFSSETIGLPGNNFPLSVSSQGTLSGGQSVFRPQGGGTKTYGYIAGGVSSPPFIFYSDIYRIDFSTDGASLLPNVGLPPVGIANGRRVMASVSSNYYGYFGGGYFPPGFSPSYYNRIDRIDFSNSTSSVPGKNLSTEGRFSGTSSSSYGFFTGYNGAGSVTNTQLLDFSTEITSSKPQPNGGGGGHQASVSNTVGNYGYTMDSAVTRRIDFSTSNISLPGQDTPLASRTNIAGFENRQYGYFGGGYRFSPGFYFCVLDRLDFSNETYTASTNLPLSRSWHSSASSNTNGYFFVGTLFPGATVTSSAIKFDFASSLWNEFSGSLIPTRYQTSALSN